MIAKLATLAAAITVAMVPTAPSPLSGRIDAVLTENINAYLKEISSVPPWVLVRPEEQARRAVEVAALKDALFRDYPWARRMNPHHIGLGPPESQLIGRELRKAEPFRDESWVFGIDPDYVRSGPRGWLMFDPRTGKDLEVHCGFIETSAHVRSRACLGYSDGIHARSWLPDELRALQDFALKLRTIEGFLLDAALAVSLEPRQP